MKEKRERRMLLALIVLSLVILALVILAGVAVSGLLWLSEENASLREALHTAAGA